MKIKSDNISISEFVPVFTKRPGLNSEQQQLRSITGLSSFVSDVNNGIIGGIRWWVNNLSWSSTAYNNLTWSSGTLTLSNGSSYNITGASTTLTTVTYVYLDSAISVTSLQVTTVANNSVWPTRILVCVANLTVSGKDAQFQVFWGAGNSVLITADNIAANSITGNEVQANSIKANNIDVTDLFAQTITASGTITGGTLVGAIIKTATTGGRTEVLPWGMIRIYNSSNILRTEIINEQIVLYDATGANAWYLYWFSANQMGLNWSLSIGGTMNALNSTIWANETVSGTLFANGKLKIPVWSNLY